MNERTWNINYWIKEKLKAQLQCKKEHLHHTAEIYELELNGMLQYMRSVGDISEETYYKVHKISTLIRKKYR